MNDTLETEFPTRIAGLEGLANNLWWTWHQDARGLFQRLDPTLWALSGKNAVEVLRRVDAERLAEAARDPVFLREYDAVTADLDAVLQQRRSWYRETQLAAVLHAETDFSASQLASREVVTRHFSSPNGA